MVLNLSGTAVVGHLAVLEQLPALQVCNLASTAVEGDIASLACCPQLTDVSFWGCGKVSDWGKSINTVLLCSYKTNRQYTYIYMYVCMCTFIHMHGMAGPYNRDCKTPFKRGCHSNS